MTLLEKIKSEFEAFNLKKQALVEELRTEFPTILKPLFAKSQLINSISWTQYTPYFADGDECVFSVNRDVRVNGQYADDLDWFNETVSWKDSTPNPNYNESEVAIIEEFNSVLESIPDDFFRDLFGDHVQVTVNRDGTIKVDEYEHD